MMDLFTPRGWVCPQCHYSWNNAVVGCMNCNRPDHEKTVWTTGTATLPPQPKPKRAGGSDVSQAN